jgi:hypothetical protein
MAIVITPESELGKEYAKWNKPYVFQPFPQMLYRARKRPDGTVTLFDADGEYARNCYKEVHSEDERQREFEAGWCPTPDDALKAFEAKEKAIADSAAHRAYEDRNMSEAAQAEVKAIEDTTAEHIAEVPVAKRRGRPPKVRVA